jgi:hypothetical protein
MVGAWRVSCTHVQIGAKLTKGIIVSCNYNKFMQMGLLSTKLHQKH